MSLPAKPISAEIHSLSGPSEELLAKLEQYPDLPSPPHIAAQIIELLKDPEADFKELMDSIAQDPALVAKILKTANSAMYARRREVTNMAQALLTLGQSATTTLALSFSLVSGLEQSSKPLPGFNLDFFWRRSLLAGFSARCLGSACGNERKEELFLAALLQDIGLMVLAMVEPHIYDELDEKSAHHETISRHEAEMLGVDHAWIGAWLLERWELPSLICDAVRHSHCSDIEDADNEEAENEDADNEVRVFTACVEFSGKIADLMLSNASDERIQELAVELSSSLDLEEGQILEILDKIAEQVPDIESQFGMSVLNSEQASEITGRAHTLLSDISLRLLREISDLKNQTDTLVEENSRDMLTGLYSRAKMDKELDEWVTRALRHDFPLTITFMDLDGFKSVNDVHGHPAGDAVLKSTAALLSKQIRSSDTLARFGGDEFVLLLGGERKTEALIVCHRILKAFESVTHAIDGELVEVHISIGLASLDMLEEPTAENLLEAADKALLAAKSQGKARVVSFDEME